MRDEEVNRGDEKAWGKNLWGDEEARGRECGR